jgi:Fe-S-cluster containining protein
MSVRLRVIGDRPRRPVAPRAGSPSALQAPERKFWGEKYLGFRCTHCGNCCSDTIVPIALDDLRRLTRGTGLAADAIVSFYGRDEFQCGGSGLLFVELDVGPRTMGLRKRRDARNGRDACEFFKRDRCSVYEHRPVTCRIWPFTLGLDDRGHLTRLEVNRAVECPHEMDGVVDRHELVRDWRLDDRQDARFRRVVDRWNRRHRGGSATAFLAFLGFVPR